MKNLMLALGVFFVLSCSKSDSSSGGDSSTSFLKITVDGNNYEVSSTAIIAGTGGSPLLSSCSSKPQFKQHHTLIENASFFFQAGMVHHSNAIDFGNPTNGTYNLYSVTNYFNNPYCYNNLTFDVEYHDKTSGNASYVLQPGGTHHITAIKQISSDNANTIYAIEGNFAGSFRLNGGTKTSTVSGTYRMHIRVFK